MGKGGGGLAKPAASEEERLVSLRGSLQQRLARLWNTCGYCQFDFRYHPGDPVRAHVPDADRTKVVCVEYRPRRIMDYLLEIVWWCEFNGAEVMDVEPDDALNPVAYLQRGPLDQQERDLASFLKLELPDTRSSDPNCCPW